MIPEFGGDSVGKRFSSQTNQGLISLEQMVVVVFTVGEMNATSHYTGKLKRYQISGRNPFSSSCSISTAA
jgi:hypothetical protein